MSDRRQGGLVGWVRRRLYFRGSLLILGLLYAAMAAALPASTVAPMPALWHAMFGIAAASTLAVVAKPRVRWLRQTSGAFAVMAPAARALALLSVSTPLGTIGELAAGVAWATLAFLAFVGWPTVLPPHIDAGRLAARVSEPHEGDDPPYAT